MGKDADGDVENVKVAVRVRPFNKREKDRKAKVIISMSGNTTNITNPENSEEKKFTFDHSYWSFDGSKDRKDGYAEADKNHKNGKKFCDQQRVFDDIGRGILDNAWKGFNASLFAYGQTGSGKSWSVIGYGANKGIVPMFCEELFKGIKSNDGASVVYEVNFSMLEIYNEIVRDLLDAKGGKKRDGLKVRQHPKKGFYADGLTEVSVASYEEIVAKMDEGTVNRTVASTNMNATSSRAHTIVGIHFVQISKNAGGKEMSKGAVINLVDLAGSERVESTGATGDRLKEGAGINQSLSCLGNVIHALAEESEGKKTRVPYRDSKLTKLLQNALGGNSKTVMIAAITDRAKQIKTKATVNEDPTDKMIRELKEENERLMVMLKGGKMNTQDLKDFTGMDEVSKKDMDKVKMQWQEELEASMAENAKAMNTMKMTYEEKLKAYSTGKTMQVDQTRAKTEEMKKIKAHIYNLNMDPQLSGRLVHFIEKDATEIGNQKGHESDICMIGPGIHQEHAMIKKGSKKYTIKPFEKDCRILVNGSSITGETDLDHNDRLVFGSTQTWVFQNPNDASTSAKKFPPITYEFSQEEIASKAGINMEHAGSNQGYLLDQLVDVMPAVEEANSISEELDKQVKFEIMLVSPDMLSKLKGGKHEGFENHNMKSTTPEVCVKMKNLVNGTEFIWPKEKFLNRLYLMKEMYNNYEEEDEWDVPEENDPFQQNANEEVLIGAVPVFLQTVAYMIELKEQLEIMDLKGNKIGMMNVEIAPCNGKGVEFTAKDDMYNDTPADLVGKEVNFMFKIVNCRGLPNKYTDVHCRYRVYLEDEATETERISLSANPDFGHIKMFAFKPVTQQLVDHFESGCVNVELWGKQFVRKSAVAQRKGLTTKDMLKQDRSVFSKTANLMNGFQMNGRVVDPQKQSVVVELLLMKKTQARLQQKCDHVKKMLERAEALNRPRVSTHVVKAVFSANTDDQYKQAMKALEGN
eukprot:maker-scaffold507_size152468-snap-gene-0.36 protein:Tk11917 transcript:maker-scaffold507_size152468-snap-gene-0.36-mRNA-1 annotation:"kinesin-like protein kif28p-like"